MYFEQLILKMSYTTEQSMIKEVANSLLYTRLPWQQPSISQYYGVVKYSIVKYSTVQYSIVTHICHVQQQ